jgi:SAM-dependent methyltransferase
MAEPAAVEHHYLLGDSRPEAVRLERQAALWDPVTLRLLDHINIQRGWSVLEIGPGHGSIHLELRRRAAGSVDAVEPSAQFCSHLRNLCMHDGFGEGRLWQAPLLDASFPANNYDLIFARWVMLFVRAPDLHVRKLGEALKPGSVLALQDYGARESFALIPRPAEWEDFLLADRTFFATQSAETSIGGHLPTLYRAAGLEVVDIVATCLSGGSGTAVWNWLWEYFLSVRDRYAEIPPLSPSKVADLSASWQAAANDPHAIAFAPMVVGVVGRKR